MDFGIGFISTNIMLPILDFFYGIVPSYGFSIIALTLVIRLALYPLSAGQIRNMRKMKITQPLMKERQEEIQRRYKDDSAKQQEEMGKLMKEFGNPLAGCLPLLLQMPILFALFATLRGSPFADISYTLDAQILPKEHIEVVTSQPFQTKPNNIYISDGLHFPLTASFPKGNKLEIGEKSNVVFENTAGESLAQLTSQNSYNKIQPIFEVVKGAEKLENYQDGTFKALYPGEVTIKATIPGIAANKGFLFIKALGQVGVMGEDGTINWDILAMILFFGASIYVNQELSGTSGSGPQQQQAITKITPILFSGMFLFFPLPAGVLMYIVVANVFQTLQSLILMREPLPENLQKLVEQQQKEEITRESLPFEKRSKKKEKTS